MAQEDSITLSLKEDIQPCAEVEWGHGPEDNRGFGYCVETGKKADDLEKHKLTNCVETLHGTLQELRGRWLLKNGLLPVGIPLETQK